MMCVKLLQQKENGLYKEMGCVCIICAYTWCECECRIIANTGCGSMIGQGCINSLLCGTAVHLSSPLALFHSLSVGCVIVSSTFSPPPLSFSGSPVCV
jgi:hypothetical protein